MFVTTHSLVAATIAIKTGNPYIYVPAALANHFLLDFFPHFGIPKSVNENKRRKILNYLIVGDAIIGTSIFFYVLPISGFSFAQLFLVCFLSGWPDLVTALKIMGGKTLSRHLQQFHEKIQNESYAGVIVELLIVAFCWYILFK